jgi:hypothetical protein
MPSRRLLATSFLISNITALMSTSPLTGALPGSVMVVSLGVLIGQACASYNVVYYHSHQEVLKRAALFSASMQ